MARIAINDIQESESFLTELNHTDLAMDQINGGFFFLSPAQRLLRRQQRRQRFSQLPFGGFFLGLGIGLLF